MTRGRQEKISDLAAAAIPLVLLAVGSWILAGPPTRMAFRLYDDAYYYFGVARSLASGMGSTFDGIHVTNGYHPLWAWILVPVFRVFRDPDSGVRAAGALWIVLAAASSLAVAWAVRPRSGPTGAAVASAIFALFPVLGLALERPNGLETPLYALAIALAIGIFERIGERPSGGAAVALGVAAGSVALARLDGAFLAFAAAILLLARPGPPRVSRAAVVGIVSAALIAPFLLWGVVRVQSAMPVSGQIVSLGAAREREALGGIAAAAFWKRRAEYAARDIPAAMARVALDPIPGSRPLRRGILPAVLAVGAWWGAVTIGLGRRRKQGPLSHDALALLAVFALLHYAAYASWLWTGGEERYRLYYFLPQWMAFSVGVGSGIGPWGRRRARGWVAAALVGLMTVLLVLAVRNRDRYQDESFRPMTESFVYGWIREHLPEDAVLGARDAGKLGWFSGRRVVNLDGLINDRALVEAIRDGREAEYIAASPIDYLFFTPAATEGFPSDDPETLRDRPVAAMLHRLDARPDCRIRRVPGPTAGWAVFEVIRPSP